MLSEYLSRATLFPNNRLKVAYLMEQGQLRIGERDLEYLKLLQIVHVDVCRGKSTAEEFLDIFNKVKKSMLLPFAQCTRMRPPRSGFIQAGHSATCQRDRIALLRGYPPVPG
jgi:hypothetical protein